MLAYKIQQSMKRLVPQNQVWLIPWVQSWFNIRNSTDVIQHENILKMFICWTIQSSNKCKKVFANSQHSFLIEKKKSLDRQRTGHLLKKTKQNETKPCKYHPVRVGDGCFHSEIQDKARLPVLAACTQHH